MCQRDFDRIIQTSSFLQLSYDQVQRYLKMANILVKDELNLLKVICKWIDHDLTTRSNHAKDLLENVHYARLSADEIRDLNVNYNCLDECEEAKTFLNIISCAKLDKYHDLKCDEVEVAKLHLEKPARRVKREYYLICEFKKIDDDDGYYCGEELKVIHYDVANHDQQNEIKISAIKETRIESMENKFFQNISLLNRFFFIGLNQIAEINHHHEIKIYQIARSVWYLQGNWWFTSKKEDSREVTYLVNLETKMWHQCPMTGFDFFSVERVCIHREYFFMIGENKRGAFIKSMNLSDNSWKESNVILHSPVKLVLSSQDNIYVITDKMDLHKIVTDEGVVTKSELLGSIPVKKKKKLWYDAVGTVDDGIIYMWVKSDYIVTLYTYDIKQKSFAVKRKDKIVKELEFTMDQPDFTMLNIFNPLAPM